MKGETYEKPTEPATRALQAAILSRLQREFPGLDDWVILALISTTLVGSVSPSACKILGLNARGKPQVRRIYWNCDFCRDVTRCDGVDVLVKADLPLPNTEHIVCMQRQARIKAAAHCI